jgi:hypothetical protein
MGYISQRVRHIDWAILALVVLFAAAAIVPAIAFWLLLS